MAKQKSLTSFIQEECANWVGSSCVLNDGPCSVIKGELCSYFGGAVWPVAEWPSHEAFRAAADVYAARMRAAHGAPTPKQGCPQRKVTPTRLRKAPRIAVVERGARTRYSRTTSAR